MSKTVIIPGFILQSDHIVFMFIRPLNNLFYVMDDKSRVKALIWLWLKAHCDCPVAPFYAGRDAASGLLFFIHCISRQYIVRAEALVFHAVMPILVIYASRIRAPPASEAPAPLLFV